MRKGLVIIGLLCCFISMALSKQVIVQPWQKENILIPSTSEKFIAAANPTQMRLLTKYYTVEQAYADLAGFILALPVDSSRTLQTIADKKPQLTPALEKLIRNKAVLSDFEYTSDSSAQMNIAIDPKYVVGLFQPYWKPEPVPKPKVVKVKKPKKVKEVKEETAESEKEAKEEKPAAKPEEKKAEPMKLEPPKSESKAVAPVTPVPPAPKPIAPAKPESKAVAPVAPVPPVPKPIAPEKRELRPVPPYTPAPIPVAPVNPNPSPNPIPDAKKEDQLPKQDSTSR